jgi:Uma2 family endonuclease
MEMSARPEVRRLTTDEAMRMVDTGILRKDEPVELLDGVLVVMSSQGPAHAEATANLADRLRVAYAGRAKVREEKPLFAGEYSLPEPDIAVVRGQIGTYASRHPNGSDAILVVELAWSSQAEDRRKASVYAAAGVHDYWILDLAARTLEVHTRPEGAVYRVTQILAESDFVSPPELGARWLVRDLLL